MIKSYRIDPITLLSITRSRYDIGITLNSVNFIGKLNVGAIYTNAHLRKIYLIHRQSGDITIFEKDAYLLR